MIQDDEDDIKETASELDIDVNGVDDPTRRQLLHGRQTERMMKMM